MKAVEKPVLEDVDLVATSGDQRPQGPNSNDSPWVPAAIADDRNGYVAGAGREPNGLFDGALSVPDDCVRCLKANIGFPGETQDVVVGPLGCGGILGDGGSELQPIRQVVEQEESCSESDKAAAKHARTRSPRGVEPRVSPSYATIPGG